MSTHVWIVAFDVVSDTGGQARRAVILRA
jgi:hypothetical protein